MKKNLCSIISMMLFLAFLSSCDSNNLSREERVKKINEIYDSVLDTLKIDSNKISNIFKLIDENGVQKEFVFSTHQVGEDPYYKKVMALIHRDEAKFDAARDRLYDGVSMKNTNRTLFLPCNDHVLSNESVGKKYNIENLLLKNSAILVANIDNHDIFNSSSKEKIFNRDFIVSEMLDLNIFPFNENIIRDSLITRLERQKQYTSHDYIAFIHLLYYMKPVVKESSYTGGYIAAEVPVYRLSTGEQVSVIHAYATSSSTISAYIIQDNMYGNTDSQIYSYVMSDLTNQLRYEINYQLSLLDLE